MILPSLFGDGCCRIDADLCDFSEPSDLFDLRLIRFLGMGLGVDSDESLLGVLLLPGVLLPLLVEPIELDLAPIGCGGLRMLLSIVDLSKVSEFCDATSESEYIPNSSSGDGEVQGVIFMIESDVDSAGDDGVSNEDTGELNLNSESDIIKV